MNKRFDKVVLLLVVSLIVIGLTAVYSSTSVVSPALQNKGKALGAAVNQFSYLKKQFITVLIGMIAMFAAYKIPIEYLKKMVIPLLAVSLVCLLLVFTSLGISAGGARRWLRLWPSSFQPSELVKLSMVIFLAWYMSLATYSRDKIVSFIIPICVMGVFQLVFLKQPDFGATMSLAILTVAMLFLSGTRMQYLLSLGLVAIPVIIKLIMEPYRLKRVTAFLDPWKDPQGSGFQLTQSFIAFGSGGLQGVGLGESKQKLSFLPEVHTDFIFSLIGEELGFIGAVVVVALFCALFVRGFMIARKIEDPFAYYLASGISLMIGIQSVFNFAVVTGLVPTKGLPLPFISYGGSSLVISMVAAGLLLNVSRLRGDARTAHGILHIRQKSAAADEATANEETKASQYALGKGYGQFNARRSGRMNYFKRNRDKS
ncbi:MAG TPA: putative lipid II flippase FtsW [Dissulfurispiraceae bacterium]|nr:putative lipid II flippase FtsW [Dissulfurispiraceae bacterium]